MSTILHRREINVAISAEEAAKEFSEAPQDVQAAFLMALADETSAFNWCSQCSYIAEEFAGKATAKGDVVHMLETLLGHLKPS